MNFDLNKQIASSIKAINEGTEKMIIKFMADNNLTIHEFASKYYVEQSNHGITQEGGKYKICCTSQVRKR